MSIGRRLALGTGIICVLLATVVGTTIVKLAPVREATERTVALRMPVAMTAGGIVAELYASLAALRGWLVTGSEGFKAERKGAWQELEARRAEMDRLAAGWDSPSDTQDWSEAKPLLERLHAAQDKIEAVAHTPDEQPAAKILATEAAPLAELMLKTATAIIDEEGRLPSSDRRKSLLLGFADLRGSLAMAIGAIRAYLLTGDPKFKTEYETLWALNGEKLAALGARRDEMTPAQQGAFNSLVATRAKFAPLPDKMFAIRASDRWNMAQWLLTREAVPNANHILDIFLGEKDGGGRRAGGMVTRQGDDLVKDGQTVLAETNALTTLLWVLTSIGIGAAAIAAYLTTRSIIPPMRAMTAAMGRLAKGDHCVEIPATDREDEIGLMARAMVVFKESMIKTKELAARLEDLFRGGRRRDRLHRRPE